MDLPKSGRPRKLTPRDERKIRILSRQDPTRTANEIRCAANLAPSVSVDTIKRSLRRSRLFGRIACHKPALSSKDKHRRKMWCTQRREWCGNDWQKIIFSDECKIDLHSKHRQYVRRPPCKRSDSRYIQGTRKFTPSIMVWAAIRYDGERVIIRCENKVDSKEYQRVLDAGLPMIYSTRFTFQQDGATYCHTSHSTMQYLQQRQVRVLPNWPPQSPDLSPIENLWNMLKRQVRERNPMTQQHLWVIVEEEFHRIPSAFISDLYDSIPKRIASVVAHKVGNTSY